jgi:hypothetical protein
MRGGPFDRIQEIYGNFKRREVNCSMSRQKPPFKKDSWVANKAKAVLLLAVFPRFGENSKMGQNCSVAVSVCGYAFLGPLEGDVYG